MMEKIFTVGRAGRFGMLALLLIVSALAAFQLPHLSIDRSDERLVGADDPGRPAIRQMEKNFGTEQSVFVYLRAKNLWTTGNLKAIQDTTNALLDTPGIISAKSVLSATNIRDKGNYVDAGPLVDIVPTTPEGIATIRDDAKYSPLIRGNYLSTDGLATALTIGYSVKADDPDGELKVYHVIEEKIAPLREKFDVVFQLGWPRLNFEIDGGLKTDMTKMVPLSVLVLLLTVTVLLRSPGITPIPLITAALTVLWTFGFMAAVGIPITLLTAILPALIIVVGSVEDVHMTSTYLEGLETGVPNYKDRAVAYMAHHAGVPILITSGTNILGFASNIPTDIPLIREFSIAASVAMLANFFVTVFAMPMMLRVFGPKKNPLKSQEEGMPDGLIGVVVRTVEKLTERRPVLVLTVIVLVVAGIGLQIKDLKGNNDPMGYFSSNHSFVVDAQKVHNDLAGLQSFSLTLHAKEPHWFKTVEGLAVIADAQRLLDSQKLYDKTLSLADLMSLMHQEMHKGDKAFFKIPQTQADYDLYLSTMPRSELQAMVTEDFSDAQISVRHNVTDSSRLNEAIDKLETEMPAVVGHRATFAFAGKNLMINRAAESLISNEIQSLEMILGVIFLLFSILYTSWLAGVVALVPTVIPILLNFGVMGALGVPLNPGTAMVAAIAIGLAVDDTIHLLTRFGKESRTRVDERAAVRATIRGESIPILTTAVALALGFAVFGLSQFKIIAEFGLLAAGTMIYAAICDLLLMPILLKHVRLATVWDILALEIDANVLKTCPLFVNMSSYQVKKLILLSEVTSFTPGQVMITEGESSAGMYVIVKGDVSVSIRQGDADMVIAEGHAGELFGEVGFSVQGAPRTATIVAKTAVTAVRLEAAKTQKGLRLYPSIERSIFRNISAVLGARLQESHERLRQVSQKP